MFENNPVTKLLKIKYPIIQGGMAWVADADLAAAVSNGGGLGIIAAANMPPELLERQIIKIRTLDVYKRQVGYRVADMRFVDRLYACADKTDLSGAEPLDLQHVGLEYADLVYLVIAPGRHEADILPRRQRSVHHADIADAVSYTHLYFMISVTAPGEYPQCQVYFDRGVYYALHLDPPEDILKRPGSSAGA